MRVEDPLFVQSLAKGFRLLEAFAQQPGELSLNQLAALSGLDRSTVQRMAHTLVSVGYLERGNNGRGYTLGKRILERTFDYLRSNPLLERASSVLIDLQKMSGERVDLSLFDDLSIIYAMRRQTKRQTFFATLVGRRIPTFSSSGGRAILSHLPEEEVDDILARSDLRPMTPKTITNPAVIKEKVQEARAMGYAVSLEENLLGEIVLASPILDYSLRPVAAVHISSSLSEWDPQSFTQKFGPLAIETARALKGYSGAF